MAQAKQKALTSVGNTKVGSVVGKGLSKIGRGVASSARVPGLLSNVALGNQFR
jgi:hypothetical protein